MAKKAAEKVDRKKPERLGGMGDAKLAEALSIKVFGLIKPIQSRPRFAKIRSVLFAMFGELNEIAQEPETEPGE